jgi:peptidoglycan/xylan/chitin deacetylase (PgdA/CDA1 family)
MKLKIFFSTLIVATLLSGVLWAKTIYSPVTESSFIESKSTNVEDTAIPTIQIPYIKEGMRSRALLTVPVLVYHSVRPLYDDMTEEVKQFTVSPETFEKELQYLKDQKYSVISFNDLVEAIEGKRMLPVNPVVITLDDGWKNQYQYAFPLLRRYAMPATFFIFTNAIGHDKYLTWDDVKELSRSGMTIGSHSRSHPFLQKITDEEKLDYEIVESKSIIEKKIGKRVDLFAYPFGGYTDKLANKIKSAGYKAARRFSGGVYVSGDSLFSVKGLYATENFKDFKKLLQ